MKKILFLFVLAATLLSCSSSSDESNNSPKVLQKVVFYRNTPEEKQWNITNGLLTHITLADGTITEEFVYDNLNRVIRDIKYANGTISESHTITYNSNGTISSIDNLPYFYNAATKTYLYSYGSNFTINCEVNDDMLAVNFTRTGFNPSEYHMSYSNGNMTSFEKSGNNGIVKNFHFDAAFGNNPIYNAVLAIARVKSLLDPAFFIDCQASKDMANGFDKGSADPLYYNYGMLPDSKLVQIGIEVLDNNNFVSSYSFADYYYQ